MSDVKISVIVPVYNAEAFLEKSMGSLMEQKMEDIEFVCVDDGSTDSSWTMLESYAQKDKRFKIFRKENEGVSLARNAGLDHAQGQYIMFLDADDWYAEDTCKKAYDLVKETESDVAIFAMEKEYANSVEYYGALGNKRKHFAEEECHQIHRSLVGLIGEECKNILEFDYLAEAYLKIYRRDIIEKENIRFYDIRKIGCFEDGFFNIQYFAHVASMFYSPEVLYHYRKTNESSITTKYRERLDTQWQHMFEILSQYVEKMDQTKRAAYQKALNNRIAFAAFGLGLNAVSENASYKKRYKNVKSVINNKAFDCKFSAQEIKSMSMPLRIFFSSVSKKRKFTVFLMLLMMEFIRNKKRGK